MDGRCVGLVGIARDKEWGLYFSDYSEELKPYLKSITILRVIKASLDYCRQYRGPVLSIATDADACVLLHRLGFSHLYGAWYGWLK